jgi:type III restriction enzyme
LARRTIEGFNASLVVELSATPRAGTNIISRVSGKELLDEEMIKLPLNIATSGQKSWKDVLTQARDRRETLARLAAEHAAKAGEWAHIRPIILVQVVRTGKDQRGAGFIHSEQVKEYLIERLGVPETAIAIKTSETDDIEGIDLLDPLCPVEWIITKSALQEGWDCPFAYILVSLNNVGSGLSMTQLVGRILRQPYQERTAYPELNESYVYCLHRRAGEIAREVKKALEKEGYEGEAASAVVDASGPDYRRPQRAVQIREEFLSCYKRPYAGKIYLPHFCVKNGRHYEALDYFRHLISRVDVERFPYGEIDWPLADALKDAKDRFYTITIGEDLIRRSEKDVDALESDEQVLAWIAASLPMTFLSHKQIYYVAQRVYERLVKSELDLRDRLALVKFIVRDKIQAFVQGQIDEQTEAAFAALYNEGRLRFYLECAECRFEIPASITVSPTRRMTREDGEPLAKSLFDYVEDESQNEYERAIALCLDSNADVLWWYRNLVGPEHFTVQGYKRYRIRPDFVVQSGTKEKPEHRVIVIESKGAHLEGHPDTEYKRKVARYFEKVGKKVTWQQLGEDFKDHVFRFQILDEAEDLGRDWRDELHQLLATAE